MWVLIRTTCHANIIVSHGYLVSAPLSSEKQKSATQVFYMYLSIKGENIVAAEFCIFHRQGEGYICVLY
jgi:hypothetical protein